MRNRRNLRHRQRMERVQEAEPLAWLHAVDWDDDGDPAQATAETVSVLPLELVA